MGDETVTASAPMTEAKIAEYREVTKFGGFVGVGDNGARKGEER